MATANLDLELKVKGLSDLQKLERRITALEKNSERLTQDLGKTNAKIDQLNAKAIKASKGIGKLNSQVKGFVASIIAAGTAQAAFNTGLNRIQSETRLKALARGYNEIDEAQAAATRTAKTYNLSQTEANKQFANLYGRLRPLGLRVGQIEDAFGGLSTAAKNSGLDAAGSAALFTQVSQALGSGTVQAEELNTIIDQSPQLVVALAKELKVTAGEVKGLAADGKVSSEQLFKALLRVKTQGVDVLAESLDSPGEKIKAFQNTTQNVVAALTSAVIPELTDAIVDVEQALEALIPLAQVVGRVLSAAFRLALVPVKNFGDLVNLISQGKWQEAFKFNPNNFSKLEEIRKDLFAPLPDRQERSGGRGRSDSGGGFPTVPTRDRNGSRSASADELEAIARLAYGPQIIAAAKANSVDPRLLAGLVQVESGFNSRAVSSAGAAGLTQLMPGTASDLGVTDRFDPIQNLMGGAKYLRQMIDMFGDVPSALRAYNQGPGNQQRFPGGVSQEAVQYPGKVLSAAQGFGFDDQKLIDMNIQGAKERLELTLRQKEAEAQIRQDRTRDLALTRQATDLERAILEIRYRQQDQVKEIEDSVDSANQAELIGLTNKIARLDIEEAITDATRSSLEAAQDLVDSTNDRIAADTRYLELVDQGINPALARELVQIEAQFDVKEKQLDLDIALLKTQLDKVDAASAEAEAYRESLAALEQMKAQLGETENRAVQNARAQSEAEPGRLQQYMSRLAADLADTEGMVVSLAQTVESEIGSAMSNAISGLIDGTKTAQEAFADMFKNIGNAFVQMASEMIAKALVMKALGILLPGASGPASAVSGLISGGGFGSGAGSLSTGGGIFNTRFSTFSGGGYTGDAPRIGGVDGQGGFPAILHPQETVVDHRGSSTMDHRGALNRYGSGGGNITVQTGDVLRFNDRDYVTMEDFEVGLKQAAKQGADGGYTRSMSTLKNSRSQRSKLGMR